MEKLSLMSVANFSQSALARFGLGAVSVMMGFVEIVSIIGMWSLVVRGPGVVCVLWCVL